MRALNWPRVLGALAVVGLSLWAWVALIGWAVALLTLIACSKASGVQTPPARYDSGPLPAGLRYLYVAAPDVGTTCESYGDRAEASNILACYVFSERLIILPTRTSDPIIFPALKRHEEAHSRGWPADHPV